MVSLKDRVLMAIFIRHKVGPVADMIETFNRTLDDRPGLIQELASYFAETHKKSKAVWTSLELNLMLGFLYLAAVACNLPVLERDILFGA